MKGKLSEQLEFTDKKIYIYRAQNFIHSER